MRKIFVLVLFAAVFSGFTFAADGDDFADRFHAGDWALYRVMGLDDFRQHHSIASIEGEGDAAVVTFAVVNIVKGKKGKPLEFRKTIGELRASDAETMEKVVRKEMVKVGGREIEADVVVETKDGKEVTVYGSDSLPVNGVILWQEKGAPPMSELLDFGWAEGVKK